MISTSMLHRWCQSPILIRELFGRSSSSQLLSNNLTKLPASFKKVWAVLLKSHLLAKTPDPNRSCKRAFTELLYPMLGDLLPFLPSLASSSEGASRSSGVVSSSTSNRFSTSRWIDGVSGDSIMKTPATKKTSTSRTKTKMDDLGNKMKYQIPPQLTK